MDLNGGIHVIPPGPGLSASIPAMSMPFSVGSGLGPRAATIRYASVVLPSCEVTATVMVVAAPEASASASLSSPDFTSLPFTLMSAVFAVVGVTFTLATLFG